MLPLDWKGKESDTAYWGQRLFITGSGQASSIVSRYAACLSVCCVSAVHHMSVRTSHVLSLIVRAVRYRAPHTRHFPEASQPGLTRMTCSVASRFKSVTVPVVAALLWVYEPFFHEIKKKTVLNFVQYLLIMLLPTKTKHRQSGTTGCSGCGFQPNNRTRTIPHRSPSALAAVDHAVEWRADRYFSPHANLSVWSSTQYRRGFWVSTSPNLIIAGHCLPRSPRRQTYTRGTFEHLL